MKMSAASEMLRCAPPHTFWAREEPCRGGLGGPRTKPLRGNGALGCVFGVDLIVVHLAMGTRSVKRTGAGAVEQAMEQAAHAGRFAWRAVGKLFGKFRKACEQISARCRPPWPTASPYQALAPRRSISRENSARMAAAS